MRSQATRCRCVPLRWRRRHHRPPGAVQRSSTDDLHQCGHGFVIDGLITNARLSADLRLTKTNMPANGPDDLSGDVVVSGTATRYALVVSNLGPDAANGAVLADPAPTGLTCIAASCGSATGGAVCPATTGPALVTALQTGGISIPDLPANSSVIFTLDCTVD